MELNETTCFTSLGDPTRLEHIKDDEMKEICEKYLKGRRFLTTKSAKKMIED